MDEADFVALASEDYPEHFVPSTSIPIAGGGVRCKSQKMLQIFKNPKSELIRKLRMRAG
jgi:hypothetical protein